MAKLEIKPFTKILNGERIKLVLTEPSHKSLVWDYIQRDHLAGGSNYSWIDSEAEVEKYITGKDTGDIDYLIFKNEQVIGSLHVHTRNYSDHKAEVGYGVQKDEQSRGYASEGLQLVLKEMRALGFNKAVIACNKENAASVRVAERNDFTLEGVLREDCLEDGVFRDSMIFGKLLRR